MKRARKPPGGYIYVMSCEAFPGVVKIGMSVDPESRRRTLEGGSPVPFKIEYAARTTVDDLHLIESYAHFMVGPHHVRGEWFRVSILEAIAAVNVAISERAHELVCDEARRRNEPIHFLGDVPISL